MHRIGRREREPRKERIVRSASLSKKDARGGTLLRSTQYSTLILSFYKFPINKKEREKNVPASSKLSETRGRQAGSTKSELEYWRVR